MCQNRKSQRSLRASCTKSMGKLYKNIRPFPIPSSAQWPQKSRSAMGGGKGHLMAQSTEHHDASNKKKISIKGG